MDGETEAGVEGEMSLLERFRALRGIPVTQEESEDGLLRALYQARDILVRYKHSSQASCLQTVIDAVQTGDRQAYSQLLRSVNMWGSAGAVWEVDLSGTATARTDNREFRKSIIEIAKQMKHLGIKSSPAEQIAETFTKWNRKNL
jgi:hypothetical protein